MVNQMNDGRGRHAHWPVEIPAEGWKDIAARVKERTADDNTSLAAAGVSFFGFLALVPGLAAAVSIYAMLADPTEIQRQLSGLLANLPEGAQALITDQLSRLAQQTPGALTLSAVVAVALALWTASSGMANLIKAINMAYNEQDQRNFLVRRGLAMLLSLGTMVLLGAIAFAVTAVFPWLSALTGSAMAAGVGQVLAWILAAAAFAFALAMLYRVGPDRDNPEWKWVTWARSWLSSYGCGWLQRPCSVSMWPTSALTTKPTARLLPWCSSSSGCTSLVLRSSLEHRSTPSPSTKRGPTRPSAATNRWADAMPRWPTPSSRPGMRIRTATSRGFSQEQRLRSGRVENAPRFGAPENKGPYGRVSWLLNQLDEYTQVKVAPGALADSNADRLALQTDLQTLGRKPTTTGRHERP